MTIAPIAHSHGNPFPAKNLHSKSAPDAATAPPAETDAVEIGAPEAADTGENTPGVIRLLQEGHFKGVADVRLRINFHDQLTEAATAAAKPGATEAAGELADTIDVKLDELGAALALDDEGLAALADLKAAFGQSAGEATGAFVAADGLAGPALTDGLQAAFDALAASLETLLVPPAAEPEALEAPEPDVPAADDVTAATPDAQELLSQLADTYAAALAGVTEALSTDGFLGELSPPTGNGVAYDKFLAQYTQLLAPTEADPVAPDAIDVEA